MGSVVLLVQFRVLEFNSYNRFVPEKLWKAPLFICITCLTESLRTIIAYLAPCHNANVDIEITLRRTIKVVSCIMSTACCKIINTEYKNLSRKMWMQHTGQNRPVRIRKLQTEVLYRTWLHQSVSTSVSASTFLQVDEPYFYGCKYIFESYISKVCLLFLKNKQVG